MPVSYRQPFLKTLPNKYLQQLFGTWGAKGLIGGNIQVPAAESNNGSGLQPNSPCPVFTNCFFNSRGLMTQTAAASGGYALGSYTPGVAIDANGWPTVAHSYCMTQGNQTPQGALLYPFQNGKVPPGTYWMYYNSTGATATNVSAAAGSGWVFGTPTVTGSSGNWTTNVQVTVPNNNTAVQAINFDGGAQNQCMPIDGTNPGAQANPAAYVAGLCTKGSSTMFWPTAIASLAQYGALRNMANAGAAAVYVQEYCGATGATSATRVKSKINLAAEGDLSTTLSQKIWSLETWVAFFAAVASYPGSNFKSPWHCWPGQADSTYATDFANLINANSAVSSLKWIHEFGDEAIINYSYPLLSQARAIIDTQGIVLCPNVLIPWCTTYQTTSGSPVITYTPTAYPLKVGDVINVSFNSTYGPIPGAQITLPFPGTFGSSGVTVYSAPVSVGGGLYQVTVASGGSPINAVSTLYGSFGWYVTQYITSVTGNGTTATVNLAKLPTFATLGAHSVIVCDSGGSPGSSYATAGPVTATVAGTGPYTITYPCTFSGALAVGPNFCVYFNTTSPVLSAVAPFNYNSSYGTLDQAWQVSQLYLWRNTFISKGRNDNFTLNQVNWSPPTGAPNYSYSIPGFLGFSTSDIATAIQEAAAINGGDASWASSCIQPYFGAPDPLMTVDGTVVNTTIPSANSTIVSFPTATNQVRSGMQVTGSLITGRVIVAQGGPIGGLNNSTGVYSMTGQVLVYDTGASSVAGTANLTYSNKFQGYITQITNPLGVTQSAFVYTGGAWVNFGVQFASGTFGGSSIPGIAGVQLKGPVFGTPAFQGAGGDTPISAVGAAFYLSATVASVGSATSPATFTPYQPTWTYATDSPAIVSCHVGNVLTGNYARCLGFMAQCAIYNIYPMAYEGGFAVSAGITPASGPGANLFGYYSAYMVSDPNMYAAQELEYTTWFGLGGGIHCPINTGPDILNYYGSGFIASFAPGGTVFNGMQSWTDTSSVGIKGALHASADTITYDPLWTAGTGITKTQNFLTQNAFQMFSLLSNSLQIKPQQPLSTDMLYGPVGQYVDTYWYIANAQTYTLTVSGSDTAGGTVNIYVVKNTGNILINTAGPLALPNNGSGANSSTVPGNTSSVTYTFPQGGVVLRVSIQGGSGNTGLCHLTIAG